jgi:hypothetical protein
MAWSGAFPTGTSLDLFGLSSRHAGWRVRPSVLTLEPSGRKLEPTGKKLEPSG